MKTHIDKIQRPGGFATNYARKGEDVRVLTRALMTSDSADFHKYIDNVAQMGLSHLEMLSVDAIVNFLILYHSDGSADVYANESLPVVAEIMAKRPIEKGERVYLRDIADIRRLKFPDVPLVKGDAVMCCIKVGWKFGLFFDFQQQETLDLDKMAIDLGALYRRLSFEHVFRGFEATGVYESILAAGWFPFVEILAKDYKDILAAYTDDFDVTPRVMKVVERFDEERVHRLLDRWAKKSPFKEKAMLLRAGVDAYLSQTESGYIQCIKTLLTELEGILRSLYKLDETKTKKPGTKALISHIIEQGHQKAQHDDSLLLPDKFLQYMSEVLFRGFDTDSGDVELSRHSASHGVAEAEAYTRDRALQAILAVDQIWFYAT